MPASGTPAIRSEAKDQYYILGPCLAAAQPLTFMDQP